MPGNRIRPEENSGLQCSFQEKCLCLSSLRKTKARLANFILHILAKVAGGILSKSQN